MPITEAQAIERKKHLGSSDMAAVLGVNPYASAYDIWLQKTDRVPPKAETPAMLAGTRFEAGVLDWLEMGDDEHEPLGALDRNVHAEGPFPLAANIDAVVQATRLPVEVKCVGLMWPSKELWGAPGSDEVPERVIVQAHVQMICLDAAELCHVGAFIAGRGFCLYRVDRNEDLCAIIIDRASAFWEKHVKADTPPDDSLPSLDLLKLRKRAAGLSVAVAPEVVSEWLKANEAKKQAEKVEEFAKAKLIAALGDAEIGDAGELGQVTYLSATRTGIDAKRLKAEQPEVAAKYIQQSQYRTLRHKAPK